MTTLLDDAEVRPASPVVPPRRRVRALAVLPWLVPALLLVAGLLKTGTPVRDVALYTGYLTYAVIVPGTLAYRALRGSRGNLPEDLGLGAATGLVLMLVGWALAAATSLQALLPGWPLLVIAPFLAVPGLRRHWRIAADERKPLPVLWSWLVAATISLTVLQSFLVWRSLPLPPVTTVYYQDLMYHLALVHEMTRSLPFEVPQVAGDALRYHYLSDADIAIGSMVTKIAPTTVFFRLWLVPISAITVLTTASLARQVAGKWWAGVLGGVAAVAMMPITLGTMWSASPGLPIALTSPSQTYSLPLVGLLLVIVVDVLRGKRLGWGWAMVFPLALACAGAKSSALPPLVAGVVAAGLIVVLRHRDRLRATVILFGAILAAMVVGLKVFAGGGAGTLSVQPLSILYWFQPYRDTLGAEDVIDSHLTLLAGVDHASAGGIVFIAGLVAYWILMQTPRLLGVVGLGLRPTRTDPAAWLLGGMVSAGVGAMFLLWHPSASQLYFFTGTIPFGSVLTIWLLSDRARRARPVLIGLAAGLLTCAAWWIGDPNPAQPEKKIEAWGWALLGPLLLTVAVAVVLTGLGLVAWRLATGRLAWRAVPVALIAAVLGAGIGASLRGTANSTFYALTEPLPKPPKTHLVTKAEMTAALWLDKHSGNDDIIATNVHCQSATAKICDARAFWVTGLSGRRTLIESWGYTDQAIAANGVNGLRYMQQPAPYPDRFAVNQRAFAQGDAADVATLRDQYHVRWLFADSRAPGGVSPNLAKVATPRYTAGPVTVYELGTAP